VAAAVTAATVAV